MQTGTRRKSWKLIFAIVVCVCVCVWYFKATITTFFLSSYSWFKYLFSVSVPYLINYSFSERSKWKHFFYNNAEYLPFSKDFLTKTVFEKYKQFEESRKEHFHKVLFDIGLFQNLFSSIFQTNMFIDFDFPVYSIFVAKRSGALVSKETTSVWIKIWSILFFFSNILASKDGWCGFQSVRLVVMGEYDIRAPDHQRVYNTFLR